MELVQISEYFSSGITSDRFREICIDAEVQSIHLSIISGRCGSTFLAHMTNCLGFGRGEEPFNEWPEEKLKSLAGKGEFDKFISKILKASVINNRFYFQIDPLRLATLRPIISTDNGPFPRVDNYTILLRRNILSQALSYYNAHATGLWHSNQNVSDPILKTDFSEEDVLYWIRQIHAMEKSIWQMFPQKVPDIYYYEDLASSPFETVSLFLQRSGFKVRPILTANALQDSSAPKKIVRDEYAVQYMSVIDKYPWLRDVLMERTAGKIPSPLLEMNLLKGTSNNTVLTR